MKHTSPLLSCLICLLVVVEAFTQSVSINTGTPHSTAILDVNSTTGGLLLPRMTTTVGSPGTELEFAL